MGCLASRKKPTLTISSGRKKVAVCLLALDSPPGPPQATVEEDTPMPPSPHCAGRYPPLAGPAGAAPCCTPAYAGRPECHKKKSNQSFSTMVNYGNQRVLPYLQYLKLKAQKTGSQRDTRCLGRSLPCIFPGRLLWFTHPEHG